MDRRLRAAFVCLVTGGLLFGAGPSHAQQAPPAAKPGTAAVAVDTFLALRDSLATRFDARKGPVQTKGSLDELHAWFGEQLKTLATENYAAAGESPTGKRVVPLGVYSVPGGPGVSRSSKWNAGIHYHWPLKTWNGIMSLYTARLGEWSTLSISPFFGVGGDEVSELGCEVSSNLGGMAEIEFGSTANWLNPLMGAAFVYANPDTGADGQGQYLYVGDRIYFSDTRQVSFDVKGGFAFWRGFDDRDPDDWFLSAGLNVHPVVDTTPAGRPFFAPAEVGADYSTVKTLGAHVLLPIRLWRGVTLAPRFGFGVGVGDDITSALALGADWRLFGDEPRQAPFVNPYVGFQHYWIDYENVDDAGTGIRPYIGGRMYLSDGVAIDANVGPAFWSDDYPVQKPDDWLAQFGLTASFGKVRRQAALRGAVLTTERPWGESGPGTYQYKPLEEGDLKSGAGEVRVYALEPLPVAPPDPGRPPTPVSVGDLSDLKFYSLTMDVGISFKPVNSKAGLISAGESESGDVMIAVLFNKQRINTTALTEANTFVHFVDLDHGQYFGYRWDANHSRQPEYRDFGAPGELEGTGGQLYWGPFDEYVRPVKWLDHTTVLDFINGSTVEKRILQIMDDHLARQDTLYKNTPTPARLTKLLDTHRIGYVRYHESTIRKMQAFLPSGNIGVTVMWGCDSGTNGLFLKPGEVQWSNGRPADIDAGAKVAYDDHDDFVFSNPVLVEDIVTDDLSLAGFAECSPLLTAEHRDLLEGRVLAHLRAKPGARVRLTGYTDATPFSPSCAETFPDGQVALATARAEAAAAFLRERGIAANRIEVVGRGIKTAGRFRWKADRSVDIEFLEAD